MEELHPVLQTEQELQLVGSVVVVVVVVVVAQ
jgi:hypothetical protein